MLLAQTTKIVSSNVPVDINNAAVTGDYVCLKDYNHLTVILHFGAVGTGTAVTMKQATDVTNSLSDEKALTINYIWINVGLTTDTLTKTAVTSSSYTVADTANNLYVMEFDSDELDINNGFDCARVNVAAGAGTTLLGILYILSGARYAGATLPSAIVD